MRPLVHVRHFTDPACPFAYSAEPVRWTLRRLFGDKLAWEDRMVGLSSDPAELDAKGLTLDGLAEAYAKFTASHGMPIDARRRPRHAASLPACRAVVAARLFAPDRQEALLRRLRVLAMGGGLLDDPALIGRAANEADIDPAELCGWLAEDAVQRELRTDMALARDPQPSAVALAHKLARTEDGWRYTCPSYELRRTDDGRAVTIPGFQPWAAYEVALANLAPELERAERPRDAAEALAWAGVPLACTEVAALLGVSREEARDQLAADGQQQPVAGSAEPWWAPRERVREVAPVVTAA
jgi:predicted DsbA family dithiol-disulfide isomerase